MNATVKTREQEWPDIPAVGPEYKVSTTPIMSRTGEIAAALAKAQGEFKPIAREKTVTVQMKSGGRYTFAYAPLEAILRATMPALSKNGIAIIQNEIDGFVETTLLHGSGQSLSNRVKIFQKEDGPQAYGGALTFARRYGASLLLCVSADDDTDANEAEGNHFEVKDTKNKDMHDPRGDVSMVNEDAAKAIALDMMAIMRKDISQVDMALECFDLNRKLCKTPELYTVAADLLPKDKDFKDPKEPKTTKAAWRALVEQGKTLANKPGSF
jgi:hypothetical protein